MTEYGESQAPYVEIPFEPVFYWYDMRPDGTSYARPVKFIDGKMVFQDRP